MELEFVNHIRAGLAEQDVYIEKRGVPGGQVIRPGPEEAKQPESLSQPIYATADAVPDDPFAVGANPYGPFAKGRALGLSLQQWLQAQGRGTYVADDGGAELHLSFEGLVPNGVYTMLTPRISFPPRFAVEPAIAGAPDGSQAMLKADANGHAAFDLQTKPLPESSKETATAIILAYNSEKAWHGKFGKNTHQQLFVFLPPPAGL